jgi:hypothetical protein
MVGQKRQRAGGQQRMGATDKPGRFVHTVGMRPLPRLPLLVVSVVVGGVITASLAAHAQGKPESSTASAIESCERAARQTLAAQAAHPVDVSFDAAPTEQPSLSNDSQIVLRGVGRWKAANGLRSFSYSCNVDLHTFEAGLVMRDSTPIADTATLRAPAEPDLSSLSPAACESSAAEALKQRWPGVSQISFDTTTRSFQQPSVGRAEFHGRGRAQPAPGAPSTFFGFDCEIDPRDGRVLRTSVSG